MSETKFDEELFERGQRRVNVFKNNEQNDLSMSIKRVDPNDEYGKVGVVLKLTRKTEGHVVAELTLNHMELSYIAREIDFFQEYGFKQELDQEFDENCNCSEVQARNCVH